VSNALFVRVAALVLLAAIAFGCVLYWNSERTADDPAPTETGDPERDACMERAMALPERQDHLEGRVQFLPRASAVAECQERFGPP
jgi:hypothetical protein